MKPNPPCQLPESKKAIRKVQIVENERESAIRNKSVFDMMCLPHSHLSACEENRAGVKAQEQREPNPQQT